MKYSIGIKYCGGCNPQYDRVKTKKSIEKKIMKLFKENNHSLDLGYAREKVFYHCLILISGCGSCCASFEQYDAACVLKIKSEDDENKILKQLREILY